MPARIVSPETYVGFILVSGEFYLMNTPRMRISPARSRWLSRWFFLTIRGCSIGCQQPRRCVGSTFRAATSAILKTLATTRSADGGDQFRYDYLTRFGDLFGARGIGRLMREGAS